MSIPSVSLGQRKSLAATVLTVFVLTLTMGGLLSAFPQGTFASHSQCSDGIDNDRDGRIDYPQDDDCEGLDDDYEGVGLSGNFITLTDGRESVTPNGSLVYIISLKQQRVEARDVNITLDLPHQANIVSASDGGAVNEHVVTWRNVSVYRNTTRTLQVNVNVKPDATEGQYLVARALVEGAEAVDTTIVRNNSTHQPQENAYRVSITDGREYVQPGEDITYTATVKNTASVAQTNEVRVTIPTALYYGGASDAGRRDGYTVSWKNITLQPGESRSFAVKGTVDRDTRQGTSIRGRVSIGAANDVDQTVVYIGVPPSRITTSISDRRQTVSRGELVTYTVNVTNADARLVATNVNVDANLPLYGQFENASAGGSFDGTNVRWLGMEIAPGQTRSLTYAVRIRPDAIDGTMLTASAIANGANGSSSRDTTYVGQAGSSSERAIFTKTADRGEVFPGSSIRYTLRVTNTLNQPLTDAVIRDRFDPTGLSLESFDDASAIDATEEGMMVWRVPALNPGESWSTSYVMKVSPKLRSGTNLQNTATITGTGLESLTRTERTRVVQAGVIRDIPQTGVGMDALLALIFAFGAFGATGLQRRVMG